MEEVTNAYGNLIEKSESKKPLLTLKMGRWQKGGSWSGLSWLSIEFCKNMVFFVYPLNDYKLRKILHRDADDLAADSGQ
jgi:hypothetical protein